MPVEISTQIIHASYAAVINTIEENANIYDNPNQQGTAYPAWFIVHRAPVEVQRDLGRRVGGNRYTITFSIDLWYMIQQNITRLFDQYTAIAEQLDAKLEYLPIFGSDAVVHVFDRSWNLEMNALKYSTTLRLRVYVDNEGYVFTPIETYSMDTFLKAIDVATISFTNETHPEFEVELPAPITSEKGVSVTLPTVEDTETVGDRVWNTSRWNIGAFGADIILRDNLTANLEWSYVDWFTLSFTNTDYPDFDVDLPEPIRGEQGTEVSLPSVTDTETVGDRVYTASRWSIGDFGAKVTLNSSMIANLEWSYVDWFTLSFTNTTHPEFAIELPEAIMAEQGTTVTLPSVSGEYEDTDYTYTPQAWSVGAFGDTVTLNDNVVANLVWHAESKIVFPKVNPIGGSSKPTLRITQTTLSASGIIWLRYDGSGSTISYNSSCSYALSQYTTQTSDKRRNLSLVTLLSQNGNLAVQNVSLGTISIYYMKGYYCTSNSVDVVQVYNASNVQFNAFRFTANGNDYYFVLDDTQTEWTKNLESIGYHYRGNIPIVSEDSGTRTSSSITNGSGFSTGKTFRQNTAYVVTTGNSNGVTTYYGWIPSENSSGKVYATNNTGSAKTVFGFSVKSTADSATVVTVLDGSNNKYNAFKYTSNGVDYYYVIDGVQIDWTDDLVSIGYKLPETAWFNSSKTNVMVNYGGSQLLMDSNGNRIPYDGTKTYSIIALYDQTSKNVAFDFAIVIEKRLSSLDLKNRSVSIGSITIARIEYLVS